LTKNAILKKIKNGPNTLISVLSPIIHINMIVPSPSTTLLGRRSAHADELEPTRSAAIRQRLASEMEEQQTQQQHVMPSSGGKWFLGVLRFIGKKT
jgi:hypothetical protein